MFENVGNTELMQKDPCLNCRLPICDEERGKTTSCRYLIPASYAPPRPVQIQPLTRPRGRPRKYGRQRPRPSFDIRQDIIAILQSLVREVK